MAIGTKRIEDYVPVVKYNEGLYTELDVTVASGATVTLPSTTTIGGSAVVALGDITSSSTSATAFTVTNSGIFVGTGGVVAITANSATSPTSIFVITANGITSGGVGLITSTGTLVTTASLLTLTANNATTAAGLFRVAGAGLTSGIGLVVSATAATLTTGRYFSANDGGLEVFGIGANGHIHTTQTTAPTAGTNATGISAIAVTAGSGDVCGTITTTGTPASGTVLTITFHKTYTTAPKFVVVSPANAAAGGVNTMPIVTQTATTFVLTWPAGGVYAATPSYTYLVVA